jgi:hypothetical protein
MGRDLGERRRGPPAAGAGARPLQRRGAGSARAHARTPPRRALGPGAVEPGRHVRGLARRPRPRRSSCAPPDRASVRCRPRAVVATQPLRPPCRSARRPALPDGGEGRRDRRPRPRPRLRRPSGRLLAGASLRSQEGPARGSRVRRARDERDWASYWPIVNDSMGRWGAYGGPADYPASLFEEIRRRSSSATLWLAEHEGEAVSGALCFSTPGHVVYWHGATLERAFPCGRPRCSWRRSSGTPASEEPAGSTSTRAARSPACGSSSGASARADSPARW